MSRKVDQSSDAAADITINKSHGLTKADKVIPEAISNCSSGLFFKCKDKVYCLVCAIKFH